MSGDDNDVIDRYLVVVSLDSLDENCWTVLHGLGEYLEKISIVVIINQDLQLLDLVQVLLHLQTPLIIAENFFLVYLDRRTSEPLPEQVIVAVRDIEELGPTCAKVLNGLYDVKRPGEGKS